MPPNGVLVMQNSGRSFQVLYQSHHRAYSSPICMDPFPFLLLLRRIAVVSLPRGSFAINTSTLHILLAASSIS